MVSRSSPLDRFRDAWAVDGADGPASAWPRLVPRAGLEWCCGDMQGMGVPAESLPMPLSAYSVNGWTLRMDSAGIHLEPGAPDPRTGRNDPKNEEGCRRHLALNRDLATKTWLAWQDMQRELASMASAKAPEMPQARPKWRPKPSARPCRQGSMPGRDGAWQD